MRALAEISARTNTAAPGPWEVVECSPCTKRGRLDVSVWAGGGNIPIANWCDDTEYDAANVELVAAAPQLLAALQGVEASLRRIEEVASGPASDEYSHGINQGLKIAAASIAVVMQGVLA